MECPGYLYAKTLRETDANAVGYKEWFAHDGVKPFLPQITQVRGAFHFTGTGGCILAFNDLEDGRGLLFRFRYMKEGDVHGRLHNRVEVMLIDKSRLSEFLNGGFVAVPNEANCTFSISQASGEALPVRSHETVGDVYLDIWGSTESFYFSKDEKKSENMSEGNDGVDIEVPRQKGLGCIARLTMAVFVFVALAAGGYLFWQSKQIESLNVKLASANEQLEKCRADNQQLRKWVADREKFHNDMNKLKNALLKMREGLSESEKLLGMLGADSARTNKPAHESKKPTNIAREVRQGARNKK